MPSGVEQLAQQRDVRVADASVRDRRTPPRTASSGRGSDALPLASRSCCELRATRRRAAPATSACPPAARCRSAASSAPPTLRDHRRRRLGEIGVVRRRPEHRGAWRMPGVALDRVGEGERAHRLAPRVDRTTEEAGLLARRHDDAARSTHARRAAPPPRRSPRAQARAPSNSPPTRARALAAPPARRHSAAVRGARRDPARRRVAALQQLRQRRTAERLGDDANVGHLRCGTLVAHLWYGSPRTIVPAR